MTAPPNILIVEDEMLVAMDIEATFLEESWTVIGPVSGVPQALSVLQTETPDAVCLDMNLNGVPSVPIATVLKELSIPFVILTGYSSSNVTDPAYSGAPIVHKPFLAEDLVLAVRTAMRV
jgi:DNA-binding response OmpR family regulator